MTSWTILFHVLGLVLWIGGLMVVTQVMMRRAEATAEEARTALGDICGRLMLTMALPGALLSVVSGVILFNMNRPYYLHAHWLQVKLLFVVVLLALHWAIRARLQDALGRGVAVARHDWLRLHIMISLVFVSILICVLPLAVYWR
jgi:uncharacterized membrane protein